MKLRILSIVIITILVLVSCDPSGPILWTYSANGTFLGETIDVSSNTAEAERHTFFIGPENGPWLAVYDFSTYDLRTTLTLRESVITGTGTFSFTANDGYFHPPGTNGNWVSAEVTVTQYSDSLFEGTYRVTNRDDTSETVSGSFHVEKSW